MNDGLADVDRRVVGTKQVLRALDEGKVEEFRNEYSAKLATLVDKG